jgi:predicted nuclease with RNAse H fold
MKLNNLFIGIDVQITRGCAYYIINSKLEYIDSGWIEFTTLSETSQSAKEMLGKYRSRWNSNLYIGIDAPRMPLPYKRTFYWDSKKDNWRKANEKEKGTGRHCEVMIKALGIANPQWTRTEKESPEWMKLGYGLFEVLSSIGEVYEVFPSATYKLLSKDANAQITLSLKDIDKGPKDMLDAAAASFTVYRYLKGAGTEIGNGDGLGSILLPTKIEIPEKLNDYPGKLKTMRRK